MNKVVVCTCSETYTSYIDYWQTVDFDFDFLADRLPYGISYNETLIRRKFNFNSNVSKKHWWNQQGNKNIIWFYAHLRMCYYYTLNPNVEWYWFLDDDVVCNDWKNFFNSFSNNNADFLSYYLFKKQGVLSQSNIPEIDKNTYSNQLWFDRFPGDLDQIEPGTDLFGSFFPIVRYSNKSLKHLTDLLFNSIHGYSEGFVPTVLNKDGFTLDTIYNSNSKSNHFDSSKITIKHKGIQVDWSWI